jgi:hypothetical protein
MKTYIAPTIHSYGTLSTLVQCFGYNLPDFFWHGSLKILPV